MRMISFVAGLICIAPTSFVARPAAAADDMTLWYRRPAAQWTEALPVGNGRLGAMVFGRTGEERIQLNENSLWDGHRMVAQLDREHRAA